MKLDVDEVLMNALMFGTSRGLEMTDVKPDAIGATRLFHSTRSIAVIVGLLGKNNGTLTLNMSERTMLFLVGRLLGEEQKEANEDCFDAIMEIGNMVAGGVKEYLHTTQYVVTGISTPSLVLGASYDVYYTRGAYTVSVDFQIPQWPMAYHRDRIFTTAISLLRSTG